MLLLATVQAITSSPVPSATPQVIKEVITNNLVPVVAPSVLQLASIAGVALAGIVTSILHLIVERKKWPANVNRLLFTLYSAVAGLVVMWLKGDLSFDVTSLTTGVTAVLAFLGSTQGMKMLTDFIGSLSTTTDASGAAVPLATDIPEAGA